MSGQTIKNWRQFVKSSLKIYSHLILFYLIHFNMRSLPKNLTSLEEIIWTIKGSPEIIAISETKLQRKKH